MIIESGKEEPATVRMPILFWLVAVAILTGTVVAFIVCMQMIFVSYS